MNTERMNNLLAKAVNPKTTEKAMTLNDVLGQGKKIVQPLPEGAHCVILKDVTALESGLEFLVEQESGVLNNIRIFINNKPEMFVNNLTPLCGQLDIDVLTVENLKSKVGTEIYVLATVNGIYTNYNFNINRIIAFLQAE